MPRILRLLLSVFALAVASTNSLPGAFGEMRTWSDATGAYTLEAELVGFNERSVVLKRADHELAAFPIDQLAEADRAYLESAEAREAEKARRDGLQTWKLRGGQEIVGRLVDYAHREFTVQRRRRRVYVNDRPLDNLPEFYQHVVAASVAHFEGLPRADRRGLQNWVAQQQGRPKSFQVEGVLVETEAGDEYAVPFFLFSEGDLAAIQPGWSTWHSAHGDGDLMSLDDQAFLLQSLAAARQHDQQVQREIALMQLKLQAVEAGLTSLWEVTLHPVAGQMRPPVWVVVPGRDSREATLAALEMNPGYVAGPIRRVSRR
ncbi:MAG TPA: SHD1 domain-containing protein [Lacipirellulaceae bacterium]|nr:SHD1 domain-containing protein [Lacipirellulaceae bacterium]